jgi:uncharacterized membrane protein (UPF0127 family)
MTSRRFVLPCMAFALLALLTACGKDAPPAAPKSIEERFAFKLGARTVRLQVALYPEETQKGLMFRRELAPDEGMLFVFDRPQQLSFWMRNTPLPLDIGYFDAGGVLREIYPLYPHDERPVASRGRMQLALEMSQGWYRAAGVKPGEQLDLEVLAAAIRARGLKPEQFGLREDAR